MSQSTPKRSAATKRSTHVDNPGLSRREALKCMLGLTGTALILGLPRTAHAASATKETTDALSSAQKKLDAVQSQLDTISNEYQALAEELNKTMDQIESVQGKIDDTEAQIEEKKKELKSKQGELSDRVASSYKNGGNNALALLLSSASFEELISNAYYVDKVNERDKAAIEEVHQIQEELSAQKDELESQKKDLEDLKSQQTDKLQQMSAKKDEVQDILDGLSSDVKALMEKRDAEILASAQEEERARKQAEAARKAAASSSSKSNSSSSSSSSSSGGSSSLPSTGGSASAAAVISAAKSTPSPGAGLCAWWVADVFINAGLGNVSGNACDMYASYCTSSNRANLKPGMIIAVSSHPYTTAGRIYGHVGIYVGNGTVMDNIGYIRSCSVDYWISYYGATITPRWGWAKGIVLS